MIKLKLELAHYTRIASSSWAARLRGQEIAFSAFLGGVIGALGSGFFANRRLNSNFRSRLADNPSNAFDGSHSSVDDLRNSFDGSHSAVDDNNVIHNNIHMDSQLENQSPVMMWIESLEEPIINYAQEQRFDVFRTDRLVVDLHNNIRIFAVSLRYFRRSPQHLFFIMS